MTLKIINLHLMRYKSILIILGYFIAFSLNAQIPSQNLFRRAQLLEYQRIKNQSRVRNEIVAFQVKCSLPAKEQQLWSRAESFFSHLYWEDASKLYSALIVQDSSFCDAYFRLAQCYVARNDLSRAFNVLQMAERKFSKNPLLYLGLGQLHTLLGYPRKALGYYDEQIKQFPNDPEGFLGGSMSLCDLGSNEEAIAYLEKGKKLLTELELGLKPNTRHSVTSYKLRELEYLYVYEAMLFYNANQTQKSLQILRSTPRAGEDKEMEGLIAYCRALCYLAKGEDYYGKAGKYLQKASKTVTSIDPNILKRLGLLLDPRDFKNLALHENYTEALNCSSGKKSKIETQEADIEFENRRSDDAAKLYSAIIRSDSMNCYAYVKLAECYRLREMHAEAKELYQSAHRKFPLEKKISLLLARQLLQLDRLDASLEIFEEVIRLDPSDYRGYYGASLALAQKGEKREAMEYIVTCKKKIHMPVNEIVLLEGALYYQLGFIQFAISSLESIPHFRKDPFALYYLSLSYHSMGTNQDKAIAYLNNAIDAGAMIDPATQVKFGLDPKVHPNYFGEIIRP